MLRPFDRVLYGLAADGSKRWAITSPESKGVWMFTENPELFYNTTTKEAFDKAIDERQRSMGERFLYPAICRAEDEIRGQALLFQIDEEAAA